MPISTGSIDIWVIQLVVIALRSPSWAEPTDREVSLSDLARLYLNNRSSFDRVRAWRAVCFAGVKPGVPPRTS
jgi:hypothetical protein